MSQDNLSAKSKESSVQCPICNKYFEEASIESHANRCIFLNCPQEESLKRKRREEPIASSSTFQDFSFTIPLAKQIEPKDLQEFFGQNHVLGEKSVLRKLLEKHDIPNMILWGPPGCGKTSLASIIKEFCARSTHLLFKSLCGGNAGVKDVQDLVVQAKNEKKFGRKMIVFMDEIHRFNKRQQDSFLLCVENGEITLIGATTENPSFMLNSALLSRCRVVVLEKLDSESLYNILVKALKFLRINFEELNIKESTLSVENEALKYLVEVSDGDARIALNNLQILVQHCSTNKIKVIRREDIVEELKKGHLLYDKSGEEHYNLISALHKSIRASQENASLYWLTRMLLSGENPLYIARRLVRAASEDIGNEDPQALSLAISTMQGCQLLGMPECDVLLAQCTIYLARAPKSREADSALAACKSFIKNFKGPQPSVPLHLRNAPTKLMKDLGYGQRGGNSNCMPENCEKAEFFL